MRTILGVLFFAVIIGMGWYINDRQNKVIEFNERIVDLLTKTSGYFDDYTYHLDKYYEGAEVDLAQMKIELNKLGKNADSVMAAAKQVAVPDHPQCREFYAASMKYLEYNNDITAAYDDIITYIASHNPGTENDFAAVDTIMEPIINTDDTLFLEVTATQEDMAKKFDFDLKSNGRYLYP